MNRNPLVWNVGISGVLLWLGTTHAFLLTLVFLSGGGDVMVAGLVALLYFVFVWGMTRPYAGYTLRPNLVWRVYAKPFLWVAIGSYVLFALTHGAQSLSSLAPEGVLSFRGDATAGQAPSLAKGLALLSRLALGCILFVSKLVLALWQQTPVAVVPVGVLTGLLRSYWAEEPRNYPSHIRSPEEDFYDRLRRAFAERQGEESHD